MALDPTLRNKMEGAAAEEPQEPVLPEAEEPAVHKQKPAPDPKPLPAAETKTAEIPAALQTQLSKIEKQVNNLNKNLADLEESLNAYTEKGVDFTPVLSRIKASQADIEQAIQDACIRPEQTEAPKDTDVHEKLDKMGRQLAQTLRENASFQVQVRQRMQHELDELREWQKGEMVVPILKELASVYSDYQLVLRDETMSAKTRKNLLSMFEQIADLLGDYGAEICVSKVGDPRPKRQCKIIEKIPTRDESMHNTIARSRKPGVMRDRIALCHEFVDVYVFDASLKPALPVDEPPVQETPENPVTPEMPAPVNETEPKPGAETAAQPAASAADVPVAEPPADPAEPAKTEEEQPAEPAAEEPAAEPAAEPAGAEEEQHAEPAAEAPAEEETAQPAEPAAEEPAAEPEEQPAEPKKKRWFGFLG